MVATRRSTRLAATVAAATNEVKPVVEEKLKKENTANPARKPAARSTKRVLPSTTQKKSPKTTRGQPAKLKPAAKLPAKGRPAARGQPAKPKPAAKLPAKGRPAAQLSTNTTPRRRSSRLAAITNECNISTEPVHDEAPGFMDTSEEIEQLLEEEAAHVKISANVEERTETSTNAEDQTGRTEQCEAACVVEIAENTTEMVVGAVSVSAKKDVSDLKKSLVVETIDRTEHETRSTRVPRTATKRKYAATKEKHEEEGGSSSSSSTTSDNDESDFEEEMITKSSNKRKQVESSSDDEIPFGNDEGEAEKTKLKKKIMSKAGQSRRSSGGTLSGRSSRASIATTSSGASRGGGIRMTACKPKIPKPWQKTGLVPKTFEGIAVQQKPLKKGEKRMLEFRKLARRLARGRSDEMSVEEAVRVTQDIKRESDAIRNKTHTAEMVANNVEAIHIEKDSDASSSDDDEWEDMELVDGLEGDKRVEVTIARENEAAKDWWALYLRQEVNKVVRQIMENTHKAHLLCFVAHLQHVVKVSMDEKLVPSLILTQMPSVYMELVDEPITVSVAQKIVTWFGMNYKIGNLMEPSGSDQVESDGRYKETRRLARLVAAGVYETDLDRTMLLFSLFVAMGAPARIVLNVVPINRRWNSNTQGSTDEKTNSVVGGKKSKQSTSVKKKDKEKNTKVQGQRDYWVEAWSAKEKRWLCVDPLTGTVSKALEIEKNATGPITYVFACDNKQGVRDVTARYASDFVHPDFRRRRTDQGWVERTFRKPVILANEQRAALEDTYFQTELVTRPLPSTIVEFKNHPLLTTDYYDPGYSHDQAYFDNRRWLIPWLMTLPPAGTFVTTENNCVSRYVLERDLLKFEAIYPPPEIQKPLGTVKGHNVYPRSTVFTLQSGNNWIKLARSIKAGEKPYKVVKARPTMKDIQLPAEQREQRWLEIYGFWQTEPYRIPVVENGHIPRNEYDNVYMYQPSMCPIGAVHLPLNGLPQIARRLKKECVPALTGWDFNSGCNYPIIEGACVLEEDKDLFIEEWKRVESGRADREAKKKEDRVNGNWRKLIKGILRLHYVKQKFGVKSETANTNSKKKKTSERQENTVAQNNIIDNVPHTSREHFTHDDMMNIK